MCVSLRHWLTSGTLLHVFEQRSPVVGYFDLRKSSPTDREAIVEFLTTRWGSPLVLLRGKLIDASTLPAFMTDPPGLGV